MSCGQVTKNTTADVDDVPAARRRARCRLAAEERAAEIQVEQSIVVSPRRSEIGEVDADHARAHPSPRDRRPHVAPRVPIGDSRWPRPSLARAGASARARPEWRRA